MKQTDKNLAPASWHHVECNLSLGSPRHAESCHLFDVKTTGDEPECACLNLSQTCSCPKRWPHKPHVKKTSSAAPKQRLSAQRLWHHESCTASSQHGLDLPLFTEALPLDGPQRPEGACCCPEGWPKNRKGQSLAERKVKEAKPGVGKVPNPCLGSKRVNTEIATNHYALRTDFAPSNAQMIRYCEHHNYKMVMNWQTETGIPAPTFDDTAIEALREKHPKDPLFPLVQRYRQTEKAAGMVDGLPLVNGRVHTEFTHVPKTGRLASRNPNLQNVPRFADENSPYFKIREMFVARPGHRLLEADFGGIEAVLTMYEAGVNTDGTAKVGTEDAQLGLRLTNIDIHGFISSHDIGQPADPTWSDADLKDFLAAFRKENRQWKTKSGLMRSYEEIRDCNKTGLYASLYGGGPGTLVRSRPDVFPNEAVAASVQAQIFGLFPSVPKWWWEVCAEADQFGYVTTPDGYRQWFIDVLVNEYSKREEKWNIKMSRLANECIAAKPQHLAMCFTGQGLDLFWEQYPQYRDGLRLTIHDSVCGEWADHEILDVGRALKGCMETPLPFLPLPEAWGLGRHLKVAVEAKVSEVSGDWRSMTKFRL